MVIQDFIRSKNLFWDCLTGYCGLVQTCDEECLSGSGFRWSSGSGNAAFGNSPKYNPFGTPGDSSTSRANPALCWASIIRIFCTARGWCNSTGVLLVNLAQVLLQATAPEAALVSLDRPHMNTQELAAAPFTRGLFSHPST